MSIPYKLAALLHKLIDAGCGPFRWAHDECRCRCPAHSDSTPSLYVGLTPDKILIRCGAGCSIEEVCDRLDHSLADLFLSAADLLVDDEGAVPAMNETPSEAIVVVRDEGELPEQADVPPTAIVVVNQVGAADAIVAVDAADLRQTVYARVLGDLELSTTHFDALRKRGLPANEISRRCYRTADSSKTRRTVDELLADYGAERLVAIPGFQQRDGRVTFHVPAGLLIPVRRIGGEIVALKVRHEPGSKGPKYTWLSSQLASCGNPVHVPLGIPATCETVRLTEGELKADVATVLSGIPTISAPGVANWRLSIPVLRELGACRVLVAFDRDGKPNTLIEIEKALLGLTDAGFDVVLETWEGSAGKGIDDFLASAGTPEVVVGMLALVRVHKDLSKPISTATPAGHSELESVPFPVDVFPPKLADYCRQIAMATATPPDFAAVTMLVTAGAAAGNSRALEVKQGSWCEGPRIYAALVGDPASGKTPAMELTISAYQFMQNLALGKYRENKSEYDRNCQIYESFERENRKLPPDQRKYISPPEEPPPPVRMLVMDSTVESLAPILEANPRGLLLVADEGVGWVRGMNQYRGGKGSDRQFWLSAWSGKTHLVDRKSLNGIPIHIPRPFLSVLCGIQPDLLGELADSRGRSDGFLHRILFSFPKIAIAAPWTEARVDTELSGQWMRTLAELRSLEMATHGDFTCGPKVVQFSEKAKNLWIAWHDAHTTEMNDVELPARLIGYWGKFRSHCARLILTLHLLWTVDNDLEAMQIEPETVRVAVRLVDYFKAHLIIVLSRLRQVPEDDRFDSILDWIRGHGGQCTARQLVRARKAADTNEAKKLLRELEERGYGRLDIRVAANNRRTLVFVFDPSGLE